jgi:hypothetical protein
MNKKSLWFGYLNAGSKSSAIIKDSSLSTGNSKTLYLYNHARDSILEYQREIVEPKLRELKDGEADVGEMQKAYKKIRSDFTPKGGRITRDVEKVAAPPPPKPEPVEAEPEIDVELDDDLDVED